MMNDTISDILTRLRNGSLTGARVVPIPLTQLSQKICKILKEEGLINAYERTSHRELTVLLKYKGPDKKPSITNLRRISKPGLRIYANHKDIPKVLGGLGIVILSTSKGIMTDREARFHKIGGEVLCSIW